MHILTVSNVPLDPALGSGYVISGYVDQLRARGHTVATLEPRDYLPWPRLRVARRLRTLLGYTAATRRALAREHFDLVELWGGESWRIASELAARHTRPLLIGRSNGLETHAEAEMQRHGVAPEPGLPARCLDRWQRVEWAFRRVDALTVVGDYERDYALRHGYQKAERLLSLENPLPDDWLAQTAAPDRSPVIGFFGSWLPRKGSFLLPAVIRRVLEAHPDCRARLVGPAPDAIRPLFPDAFHARIECLPFTREKARLRQLYAGTPIVLLPSAYESFGLVAAEALACGCALVASPTGLAASLVPDEEAVIVGARDAGDWTRAVLGVLDDHARRQRIAAAGQARVQRLRWSSMTETLEAAYVRWQRERA